MSWVWCIVSHIVIVSLVAFSDSSNLGFWKKTTALRPRSPESGSLNLGPTKNRPSLVDGSLRNTTSRISPCCSTRNYLSQTALRKGGISLLSKRGVIYLRHMVSLLRTRTLREAFSIMRCTGHSLERLGVVVSTTCTYQVSGLCAC
ncbi:hypothetical protein BXZ70DRAFT_953621 [Cristinia sonorae]|uniref:Secreted protein n=1 Tax=Cristinia sonorae TaxID=1940300 RepID=A0A8K0UGZ8_9AGAR|nr:hypothetical protein BXZ70DRAFT_953621 [Cristinia sonorae]